MDAINSCEAAKTNNQYGTYEGLLHKATENSAGYDIGTDHEFTIQPKERILVKTNVKLQLNHGFYGKIESRSGLASKHGIDVRAGVIDSDYKDYIRVLLENNGTEEYTFKAGHRIAQIIFMRYYNIISEPNNTNIEAAHVGFGSTGY